MTAYVISNVTMKAGQALDNYRRLAAASIDRHGGRYLVRGGAMYQLEGSWREAAIVLEFPSIDAARDWYHSPDYAEALRFRDDAVERDLIIIEGVST